MNYEHYPCLYILALLPLVPLDELNRCGYYLPSVPCIRSMNACFCASVISLLAGLDRISTFAWSSPFIVTSVIRPSLFRETLSNRSSPMTLDNRVICLRTFV